MSMIMRDETFYKKVGLSGFLFGPRMQYFVYVFFIFLFVILCWHSLYDVQPFTGYVDDFYWWIQFQSLYTELKSMNFSSFPAYPGYGFLFYIINFISIFMSRLFSSEALSVVLPRIVENLFTVFTMYIIYRILVLISRDKAYVHRVIPSTGFILVFFLILTNNVFWETTRINYPYFLMAFFILLSVLFLLLDHGCLDKYYYYGILSAGVAFSVRVEAIFFASSLVIFVVTAICLIEEDPWRRAKSISLEILKICAALLAIYLVLNPLLFIPNVLKSWVDAFRLCILSDQTNHFKYFIPTFQDKINHVIKPQIHPIIFFVLMFSMVVGFFKALLQKKVSYELITAPYVISLFFYLFYISKRDLNVYYLTPIMLLCLHSTSLLSMSRHALVQVFITILIISFNYGNIQSTLLLHTQRYNNNYFSRLTDSWLPLSVIDNETNKLVEIIKPYVGRSSKIILTPYMGVNPLRTGLSLPNIYFYWGCPDDIQLNKANIFVINKNHVLNYHDYPSHARCSTEYEKIKSWIYTDSGPFKLIGETDYLYVFIKR